MATRRAITLMTLAAILGIVLAATDIHRTIAGVVFPVIFAVYDAIFGGPA
jgi:hypothetical protein